MAEFQIIDSLPAKPRKKGDYEKVLDAFLENGSQYAQIMFDEDDKLRPRGFTQIISMFYKDRIVAHLHPTENGESVYLERIDHSVKVENVTA